MADMWVGLGVADNHCKVSIFERLRSSFRSQLKRCVGLSEGNAALLRDLNEAGPKLGGALGVCRWLPGTGCCTKGRQP